MRINSVALTAIAVVLCALLFLIHISHHVLKSGEVVTTEVATAAHKFYIYDWPKELVYIWPDNYSHHRISIHKKFREHGGAGPLINAANGVHHTHQYSLFTLLYNRLLESDRRTPNPAEASAYFIPYDLGMDATTRSSDGALARTKCPRVQSAMSFLEQSPYFKRSHGTDHFLLHSINQMMVFYANGACTRLYELCYNCTKLSIDTYPPGVFDHLDSHPFMTHKWLSIPFPSNFHYSSAVTAPAWNAVTRIPGYMPQFYDTERPYALCFVGSTMVTAKRQKRLRQELVVTCRARSSECLYVCLATHESQETVFQSGPAAGTGVKGGVSPTSDEAPSNPYHRAKFCLTPGGDFPTRKGFFDALHSGCVPVIFERTAALTQWPLHWQLRPAETLRPSLHRQSPLRADRGDVGERGQYMPRNVAEDCVVFLPREVAMRNMSETFDYLVRLSRDAQFMHAKLRCIAAVGFQMQYSLPGSSAQERRRWGRDAVDVILDHILTN